MKITMEKSWILMHNDAEADLEVPEFTFQQYKVKKKDVICEPIYVGNEVGIVL